MVFRKWLHTFHKNMLPPTSECKSTTIQDVFPENKGKNVALKDLRPPTTIHDNLHATDNPMKRRYVGESERFQNSAILNDVTALPVKCERWSSQWPVQQVRTNWVCQYAAISHGQ